MSQNQLLDQCIGNYRLKRLLSQSHAAEIYLAEHTLFHTEAVVKLLDRQKAASNDIDKFLAQASLLTQLQHPHIVQVFDSGLEDAFAFMIMNYAPNGTLRQRYPKGTRLPLPAILHYTRQIASALHYTHLHDLIHRDIKPHNMLLGANDDVLLTDFGIAVVSQHFSDSSAFRDFEGTVPYAAPEQLQGKPHKNSDLYALGILVYEWLCGDWPFTGSFDEIVHQHLFVPPPFFSEKNAEVPFAIEQVLRRVLAKDPEHRFADAEDFAHALDQAHASIQQPTPIPDASRIASSKRQFMSPLPFLGERRIHRAG